MSLAGAKIDLTQLKQDCARPLDLLNISILYQCRALELSPQRQSLKDERIEAAFLFVPFGNSLFSPEELGKITIPVMSQVVDRDFLTSLLTEQMPLFNSLGGTRPKVSPGRWRDRAIQEAISQIESKSTSALAGLVSNCSVISTNNLYLINATCILQQTFSSGDSVFD